MSPGKFSGMDLTEGNITAKLLLFALPLMAGNLLQQLYNIADTLIVGRFLGEEALAAVGSSYTLMVFVTSILTGLCMGSSAFFSIQYGNGGTERMKQGFFLAFVLIGGLALVLNAAVYAGAGGIIRFLRVPWEVEGLMREYLLWIFAGIPATFLYNFFANLLRSVGNSAVPLYFLAVSAILNVGLDLLFILAFQWGVGGAASATVLSQYVSGIGILLYYRFRCPELMAERRHFRWDGEIVRELAGLSVLTCMQQSIMNFGILLVQGLVNSFGTVVMAAFAAAVKIDSFAYSPVQDFGNAFSTYTAQNYGAGKTERIRTGMKRAVLTVFLFCLAVSSLVCIFAGPLMRLFIDASSTETIAVGTGYLRIEASFYFGIGVLFLFYGYFRAVRRPGVSVILTVISLGTRVLFAYTFSAVPAIGVTGIWLAVPAGWLLADLAGGFFLLSGRKEGSPRADAVRAVGDRKRADKRR